jgi:hypothetical protein
MHSTYEHQRISWHLQMCLLQCVCFLEVCLTFWQCVCFSGSVHALLKVCILSQLSLPALQLDHQFYAPDPNPTYDAIDLRALSEKRASRAALDAEWKRREALLARPYSFTLWWVGLAALSDVTRTLWSRRLTRPYLAALLRVTWVGLLAADPHVTIGMNPTLAYLRVLGFGQTLLGLPTRAAQSPGNIRVHWLSCMMPGAGFPLMDWSCLLVPLPAMLACMCPAVNGSVRMPG